MVPSNIPTIMTKSSQPPPPNSHCAAAVAAAAAVASLPEVGISDFITTTAATTESTTMILIENGTAKHDNDGTDNHHHATTTTPPTSKHSPTLTVTGPTVTTMTASSTATHDTTTTPSTSASDPIMEGTTDTTIQPTTVVAEIDAVDVADATTTTATTSANANNNNNKSSHNKTTNKKKPRQRRRRRHVIVIGSGMAGLCAARELQQRGYSVLIVEAQNRIGGRLKSYDMQVVSTSSSNNNHHHHTSNNNNSTSSTVEKRNSSATTTPTTTTGKGGSYNANTRNNNINNNNNNNNTKHKNGRKTPAKQAEKSTNGGNNTNYTTTTTKNNKKKNDLTAATATTTTVPIDIGGALIHGIIDNPVHTMVHTQMQIPIQSLSDCLLLSNTGWPVDIQQDKHISQLFNDCLSETFTRIKETNSNNSHPSTTTKSSQQLLSFGDLFDQVCHERNVNTNTPLFRWYQANLELSSGTTFHNLGYAWNDDEPYGYDGDHVAITSSWKSVCTTLGETLYVLYNSPVTNIQIVYPDPEIVRRAAAATAAASSSSSIGVEQQQQQQGDDVLQDTTQPDTGLERPNKQRKIKQYPVVAKQQQQQQTRFASRTATTMIEPQRRSQRIRGEDALDDHVRRRSHRSNKGQMNRTTTTAAIVPPTSLSSPVTSTKKRSRHDISVSSYTTKTKSSASSLSTDIRTMVQVTLQSGVTLEADAVVCTIPLGVLKDGSVTFDPPLPMPKQLAIQQLGTGLFNKCAITFTKQFWQNSDFLGMADHNHSYLILNATKYTKKPVLLFLYGGSFAKEIEEWTDHDVVTDCLSALRRICGRDCVTMPIDYHVTRWGKEPYSRMSFTYVPAGVDGLPEFKAMSQPIYDHTGSVPVVMFAGEHTTPYHPSTIHGAYLSGIREAYRYDCALEPEANNFLEFTEENVYERTFMIKRKAKGSSTIIDNGSRLVNGTPSTSEAIANVPSMTTEQAVASVTSTRTVKSSPIQSYARRLRRSSTSNASNDAHKNGAMTLRHRSKTYFQLDTSKPENGKRVAQPAIQLSAATTLVLADKSSETLPLSSTSSPILMTRRSQRNSADIHRSTPATGMSPFTAVASPSGTVVETKVHRPSAASQSPSRRSQRTMTGTNSPLPDGKGTHALLEPVATSSSAMNHVLPTTAIANDPGAIAAAIQRESRVFENRILLRSLESYGPKNYDFIYNTILPIYRTGNESSGTIAGRIDVSGNDRQQFEQRCIKLLRKKVRSDAQRDAAVLHYYKSWIVTNVAPPWSTSVGPTSKKQKKTTTIAAPTNGGESTTGKATKAHVFSVPLTNGTTTTSTTTRSGRTSNRPATMLLT